jgi:type I restriction-modification system DNA methylase subunit
MELKRSQAKENLARLIAKFERELSADRIREYNEEAAKTAFIQPFLKDVLGWDVNDRDEVSPEERISRGRVDYGLKIEGKIKIFIEAKPPKADLRKHVVQAIQYGYNRKGVPFVLLTDFEELKLFDVTVKPDIRNPLKGLKIDLYWNQYLPQFDKLWLLSKESVAQGKLDKLLLVKPKEKLPVDRAILDDLKSWRETLAKDIFKNNPELFHAGDQEKDAGYLKEIAQRILDRVIFMRSCEDRGLVHRRPLKEVFEERTETVGTNTMIFLREEFKQYNSIFNSDLFRPQEWENSLAVDFRVMRDIVLETYNPYQFDVIPLEVLGNIYEQYLGYTIRLTDHQVKYELKPEVRKAGGIYYTPEYIVDYIVENTVGKLLKELSSRKIKKLRILDLACGSGSFLIRAYEEMLNYYQDQKEKRRKTEERQRELELEKEEAEPSLTINEKSEILREHIFGVDIDEQAVEVTKLSLMLKMLEGEYGIIPGRAILPMLEKNIKCGNSLISGDTLELKKYFGDDWYKVKPLNWDREFRKIMVDEGGFDVVIGNPPWGQKAIKISEQEIKYLRNNYISLKGIYDACRPFIEKGIEVLKPNGMWGMVLPDIVLLKNYPDTRKLLLDSLLITKIDFWGMPFEQVNLDCVTIIGKTEKDKNRRLSSHIQIYVRKRDEIIDFENDLRQSIYYENTDYKFNLFLKPNTIELLSKIRSFTPYKDLFETHEGIHSGNIRNKLFIERKISKYSKPLIFGRDELQRYFLKWNGGWVNYDPQLIDKTKGEYANLGKPEYFEKPKLVIRRTGDYVICVYDEEGFYFSNNAFVSLPLVKINYKHIVGILNSKLMTWFYRTIQPRKGRLFAELKINQIEQFPICMINFSNPSEDKLQDNIVALVDVMLNLNKKIQAAKGNEKEQIQRQIEKTDREIDDLVYKLYGITEEEIKIIEGGE